MQLLTTNKIKNKRKLFHNIQGLSTMEYAVLFVVIVVGAIAAWSSLGKTMATKVQQGQIEFRDNLTIDKKGSSDGP